MGLADNLFSYSDLIDKNNYIDIKRYVIKSFESLDLTFRYDEFDEYYSILLDNSLNSSTFQSGLRDILDLLSEEKSDFKNMLLKSTAIICGFGDNYRRFAINDELLKEANSFF